VWNHLSVIIETVPSAICLLDEQLRVLAFNMQATKLLDILPKDLKGTGFLNLVGEGNISVQDLKSGVADYLLTFERNQKRHTVSLSVQATAKTQYVVQMENLSKLHRRTNNIVGNEAHFAFGDIIGQSSR